MSGEIENRMVLDECWRRVGMFPEEAEGALEKPKEAGYYHPDEEIFVSEDDAFDFAMERCLKGTEEEQKEFKDMLPGWFYSGGGWVKEE